ncbi:MAG: hypothetical protein Q7J28_11800 [Caulobacter sp.]|nr:hypothetical protein [Caulobacter sp.]
MADLSAKSDSEIGVWIANHEDKGATDAALYHDLLEERARRSQAKNKLDLEKSLACLIDAAVRQSCTTYGALAAASGVEWSKAHRAMSGAGGHLDRLLDVCHARGLPLLTALCVNQAGVKSGELDPYALKGFSAGARRLGFRFPDNLQFHHEQRDACWAWGLTRSPH